MSTPAAFASLRRDVWALARWFRAVSGEAGAVYPGIDPAGSVCVSVDGRGRVLAVELARSWRSQPDLGAAVVAALDNTTRARLAAWARACVDPPPSASAAPDEFDEADAPDEVSLSVLTSLVVGAAERLAAPVGGAPVLVHDPDRRVAVTATDGVVTGVVVDRRWLAGAPPTAAVAGALHAALDAVPTGSGH